ncbi:MAG: universal stress protein [Flavobacteriia bacterium]|nr:universal stress protein [Flavobacteriia bacterium]
MRKRFILLIDFSETSKNLIEYGCDWASHVYGEVLLLHQTPVQIPAFTDDKERNALIKKANQEAEEQLREIANGIIPPMIEVSYLASEKDLQHTLSELMEQSFENLILAGLKKYGFIKKFFLRNTIIHTIENTDNILVAIPNTLSDYSHKNIYVGISDKYQLNLFEFNRLLNFIDNKETRIVFFNLSRPEEDTSEVEKLLKEHADMFASKFRTFYEIYVTDSPSRNIQNVISGKSNELLVVQKGERLLTDYLFRKFLINDLVYDAETPLIVLP